MVKTDHDDSPYIEFSLEQDMVIVPDEFADWSYSVHDFGDEEFEALDHYDKLLRLFEDMPSSWRTTNGKVCFLGLRTTRGYGIFLRFGRAKSAQPWRSIAQSSGRATILIGL